MPAVQNQQVQERKKGQCDAKYAKSKTKNAGHVKPLKAKTNSHAHAHRRTRRGGGRPPGLEKFQGKRKLLKNPE